ncbi:expansin-like B1 [Prosopis cineraria]|uniref:expansin-like B1 n=1 Tax=Prosopis cineraria TaxID=364024 RepID=UPI00240EE1BB|nr:expansin-like B1 [Prosopis cineraria]
MELHSKYQAVLVCVMLLFPVLCISQDFTTSRATYYGSPDSYGNPRGACGYGEYGRTVNDGSVAGVSGLWKKGSGCGACYRVRCRDAQYCDEYGSLVVATDYGEGDRTDFVMSPRGYSRLGRNPESSAELFKYGVVAVEYTRVTCTFAGANPLIRIHESSKYPDYLALVVLYMPGQFDIVSMEIYQVDRNEWRTMRRAFGAVFDIIDAPHQAIIVRLQLVGTAGRYWAESKRAIPSDWKIGASYDTQLNID